MHEGTISRVMVLPHPLQTVSGSSVQISFFRVQKAQTSSSGYGFLISLLPGQLSFILIVYQTGAGRYMMHVIYGSWFIAL